MIMQSSYNIYNKNSILLKPKRSFMKTIYDNIGKSAKPIVSGTAATLVIISKEKSPIYYIAGGIVNAFFSKILKNIFKQNRPLTGLYKNSYGMPSSHAQALFYFATVASLACFKYLDQTYALYSSLSIFLYTILASSWRTSIGLHTLNQTLVGAICGTGVGYLVNKFEHYNWSTLLTIVVDFINKYFNSILPASMQRSIDQSNTFIILPEGLVLDRNIRITLVLLGTVVLYSKSIKSFIRRTTLRMKKTNTGTIDAAAGWSPHVMISP